MELACRICMPSHDYWHMGIASHWNAIHLSGLCWGARLCQDRSLHQGTRISNQNVPFLLVTFNVVLKQHCVPLLNTTTIAVLCCEKRWCKCEQASACKLQVQQHSLVTFLHPGSSYTQITSGLPSKGPTYLKEVTVAVGPVSDFGINFRKKVAYTWFPPPNSSKSAKWWRRFQVTKNSRWNCHSEINFGYSPARSSTYVC